MNCNEEKKIKYILPDFTAITRNKLLLDIYEKNPTIVRENTCIYSFFGTFPRAKWNGGRASIIEKKVSKKYMQKVRDFYNKRGIKVTFTFTNYLIQEEHLLDKYCNTILEVFNNGMNEVLVASNLLEEYIREKYPKYKINKSITAIYDKENNINEDTRKYNLVVIDKAKNKDIIYLERIKNKEQIEILCEEICVNNCPYSKLHYTELSEIQLKEEIKNDNEIYGLCRYFNKHYKYNSTKVRRKTSNYYISPNEILEKYVPLGFKYFKLSGRDKFDVFGYESIIQYIIKPEYQMDVRLYLYEQMILEMDAFFSNLKY